MVTKVLTLGKLSSQSTSTGNLGPGKQVLAEPEIAGAGRLGAELAEGEDFGDHRPVDSSPAGV